VRAPSTRSRNVASTAGAGACTGRYRSAPATGRTCAVTSVCSDVNTARTALTSARKHLEERARAPRHEHDETEVRLERERAERERVLERLRAERVLRRAHVREAARGDRAGGEPGLGEEHERAGRELERARAEVLRRGRGREGARVKRGERRRERARQGKQEREGVGERG
jgi:hypothetical protein